MQGFFSSGMLGSYPTMFLYRTAARMMWDLTSLNIISSCSWRGAACSRSCSCATDGSAAWTSVTDPARASLHKASTRLKNSFLISYFFCSVRQATAIPYHFENAEATSPLDFAWQWAIST